MPKHYSGPIHHRADIHQNLLNSIQGNEPECLHALCYACSGFKIIELLGQINTHLAEIAERLPPKA